MDIWAGPLFWPSWHATGLPSVPFFPRSTHVDSTFFGPSSGLALGTSAAITAKATVTTPLVVPHWILQCTTPPKIRTAAARSTLPVSRHAFAKTLGYRGWPIPTDPVIFAVLVARLAASVRVPVHTSC